MNIEQVRFNMVEQQIRTWDVLDTDVLDLLHVIKREQFVPAPQREYALMDVETPLTPISATARMWTPKMEARVVQDLGLKGDEHVLEVGTGSGYLTALLAARANRVTSVEIDPALAKFATDNLAAAGVTNATVITGDGAHGWGGAAPYDVIVFTGSMEVLPNDVLAQLKSSGKVFAVIGKAPVMQAQLITVTDGKRQGRTLFETVVAPLSNAAKAPAFVF
ncbi:MAG: protein-L-isoaspartate O-methyltransferase [Burkholderiales bacterium]|nr:protein-L-isoaspartate O-methyltransferase [Burkholderiales bacterium]